MKKGNLAVSLIIIAAILLIVLIIIIAMFGSNMREWGSDIKNCNIRGGRCTSAACDPSTQTEIENTNCDDYCCVDILD